MFKNALLAPFRADSLLLCTLLVVGFPASACKSTSKCAQTAGTSADIPGGAPSWCEWKILERSGPEPDWKNAISNVTREFWGEGVGETEEEARQAAEDHMRTQVARYLNTGVRSLMILREDGSESQYQGQHETYTDVNVKSMAVSDSYWERRTRVGYQNGIELHDIGYRVLVKGRVP